LPDAFATLDAVTAIALSLRQPLARPTPAPCAGHQASTWGIGLVPLLCEGNLCRRIMV